MLTTRCPHCQKNSPAFRKDGYTKMFVKPLAGRQKAVAEQRKGVQGEASETQTVASTALDKSRKTSTHNREEEEAHMSADGELNGLGYQEESEDGEVTRQSGTYEHGELEEVDV